MELVSRIETIPKKKLIGQRLKMTFANNTTGLLWKTFMPFRHTIQNTISSDLYSLQIYPLHFFENFDLDRMFEKWALVEVDDNVVIPPHGMEAFTLEGGLYAVFLYRGDTNDAEETFRYILGTWITESAYMLDNRPHFEVLGEQYKKNDPTSEEEIWIPVKLKN